jgi:hypothetical protein
MIKYNFYPFNYDDLLLSTDHCAVVKVGLHNDDHHLCGYCLIHKSKIPKAWHGDYNADALQYLRIHGGITYCHVEDKYVVFGFDCAHCYDGMNDDLKNPEIVMSMAKEMRKKILAYADVIEEWRKALTQQRCEMLDKINEGSNEELGFGAIIDVLGGASDLKKEG